MVQEGQGTTYNPTDINSVLAQYERIKAQSGGDFWTPKVGRNLIRILPPWKQGALFWRETSVHWNVGPDSKMLVCLQKELGKPCYICEVVERLQNSQDPRDQAVASEMKANVRVFYNIVDLDNVEKGIQVYTSGIKILQDVLAYFADPDWGDITHPEHGYDIVIEREGTTRENTKYQVRARKNPTPIPDMNLLSGLKNLDSFVKPVVYEQQASIYEGMSLEEAEDQFDSAAPSAKPATAAKPKAAGTPIAPRPAQPAAAKPAQPAAKPAPAPATPVRPKAIATPAKSEAPAIGEEVGKQIEKATAAMPSCFGKFLDKDDPACQHCAVQKECDEKMNPKPVRTPARQPVSEQLGEQLNEETAQE
jgi:hypothetical protein